MTKIRPDIKIGDFIYPLPEERIAKYPLAERDSSKLLVYRDEKILDDKFYNLTDYLPKDSFMVFNETKVVPARLFFRKPTGAVIEVLCLNPVDPEEYVLSFASRGHCTWKVVLGNAKKWKEGDIEFITEHHEQAAQQPCQALNFRAELISKGEAGEAIVKFKWDGGITFSEVLDICGKVPIPPYLNRDTEEIDKTRYQTVYARQEGSVAAPTAGLHFTDRVLRSIDAKGIERGTVCLHVGAGTFKPVKSDSIADHQMHAEPFSVSLEFLLRLASLKAGEKVISVGTTSTRCLESLYYIGVQMLEGRDNPCVVEQWMPYQREYEYTIGEAMGAIIEYLQRHNLNVLIGATSIIIVPSYKYKVVDIQITNFHQSGSTLLLLIAALIGEEWKKVYAHALENNYRFLSYGDSSILFR